jgi:hypothetical protein
MKSAYIYKIISKDENVKEFYIGSTFNIDNRIRYHKNKSKTGNTKLYNFIKEFDNFKFIILECFECETKKEKEQKEQEYISKLNPNLNTKKAFSTKEENYKKSNEYHKEWVVKNKSKLQDYMKKYNLDNKDNISEKRSEKINCECGSIVSKRNISTHLKSKKHTNFISSQ